MRRTQARKRGHQVDRVVTVYRSRQRLGLGCTLDNPKLVPQPLDRRPCDEDGSLKGIGRVPVKLIGDGRQQPV